MPEGYRFGAGNHLAPMEAPVDSIADVTDVEVQQLVDLGYRDAAFLTDGDWAVLEARRPDLFPEKGTHNA